jgi:hypothetical protein
MGATGAYPPKMPVEPARAVSGGGRGFAAALFGLTGLCCACMAVGYRTRAATVATWVLTMSLHVRNKKVLNGGDAFLRCA